MTARVLPWVVSAVLASGAAWAGNAQNGKKLFGERICNSCHALGSEGTSTTGPNLAGVVQKRDRAWLVKWMKAPDQMANDPIASKMIKKYKSQMPNLGLTDAQIDDLLEYIATVKAGKS